MSSVEYLSKDILEESFLKTFGPYHLVQKALGSCRVDARNRFVTAPTVWQRVYTILCASILTISYCRIILQFYGLYYLNYPNIFYLLVLMLSIQLAIFVSNLIHVRFLNGKSNMELFVKMQEIERLMKIDKDNTLNSLQYKVHLVTVIVFVGIAVGNFSFSLASDITMIFSYFSFVYCESPFTLEMSFCSNIILYFAFRVRFVNAIISNHIHGEKNATFSALLPIPSKDYMKHVAGKIHDFRSSETDVYIREIIRGFNAYKELYRFQILLFSTKIFSYALLGFEYFLLIIKYNFVYDAQTAVLAAAIIIDLMTALLLCIRCELFFRGVKETKLLSISVMSIHIDGPLREKAKRMYNILEEMPPNFSIYEMWHMNARLFLSVFNVITSFIVTLLQFAFL